MYSGNEWLKADEQRGVLDSENSIIIGSDTAEKDQAQM